MTEFKPGDRVKVEYEAYYQRFNNLRSDLVVVAYRDTEVGAPRAALTKLPDPEPEWRKGDVVRWTAGSFTHVALRTGGRWECSCGNSNSRDSTISDYWRMGVLEVLHREDQP